MSFRSQAGLRPFSLVGRMALTNYLLQIAVLDVLFSRHGLGLAMRPAYALPSAIVVFACMAVTSGWWFARYRWGPLEWLLRTGMYGKLQPIRRTPAKGDIMGLVG
ncbi:MAG: DUF418 domain-containing protein [Gemmatimonadaceae bacterium]|nr:DUF418 domain-containing protein [Gemmatimonadaceae bacterium]